MKVVLDIQYIVDEVHGNFTFPRYDYGVFLTQDPAGNTFIAVKNGDKLEKIRLEDANKDLIVRLYDEAKERESREKDMEELKNLILRVSKRTEKMDEFLVSVTKKFDEALVKVIEKYINETWVGVVELKKKKDEAKEKDPLPEDSFKGFISEDSLERIIRELVSLKIKKYEKGVIANRIGCRVDIVRRRTGRSNGTGCGNEGRNEEGRNNASRQGGRCKFPDFQRPDADREGTTAIRICYGKNLVFCSCGLQ